ncbi:hypothetical protein AGMMS49992_27770 [Clostridia bacterium]|nr:hypothetical protein AGMMS49992_27770 [Clostridia bacterium]
MRRSITISWIGGGLGNQLSEYAVGYALSKERNGCFYLDTTYCNVRGNRPYELDKLNIYGRGIVQFPPFMQKALATEWLGRIVMRLQYEFQIHMPFVVLEHSEDSWQFHPNRFTEVIERKLLYMSGYWQSEKYFAKYKQELLRQFSPKEGTLSSRALSFIASVSTENSVAIHIRRGD